MNKMFSQNLTVEPPFWYKGLNGNVLQLLVYYPQISQYSVSIKNSKAAIKQIHKSQSPNYLFIDIFINEDFDEDAFNIVFQSSKEQINYEYKIFPKTWEPKGFDHTDVIYLLMPDRFANGDTSNDSLPEMLEKANRKNPDGRHGGDLQGILNNLDYFVDLGITTLWLNPVFENNNPSYSYHGYGITNFYRVDPRLGDLELYKKLIYTAHQKGLKVIKDVVFNHCSINHWWIKDLPFDDWINYNKDYRTSYRGELLLDPYACEIEKEKFQKGWFVDIMPDLNTQNEFLAQYLIQNTLWWIETAKLDGLRIDTYAYADSEFMYNLTKTIHSQYPTIKILGEIWLQTLPATAAFQKNNNIKTTIKSDLDYVTDFPLYYSIKQAFTEHFGWSQGMARLFYTLSQDFLYGESNNLVTFLDNHDLDRFFSSINENIKIYKLALTFLLTTRGIPCIYYGTEILMTGFEHQGHGFIRKDMPGGWKSDKVNVFTQKNLTSLQLDAYNFTKFLLNYRKNSDVLKHGKLIHFVPNTNVYVYAKILDNKTVFVILNASKNDENIDLQGFPYYKITQSFSTAYDVISQRTYSLKLTVKAQTPMILELR